MATIEVLDHHVVYANHEPGGRQGYFPGLVKLPSGDLLGLFMMAEWMDAADGRTMVTRSHDQGRTWHLQGPLLVRESGQEYYADTMKPVLLTSGKLLATGYWFHRRSPDESNANPQTDGVRPGDNLVCESHDQGRTWTPPRAIPRTRPELVEVSGPAIELHDGTLLAAGSLFPMWDGTHPSGHLGVLLRSTDEGATWDDQRVFFHDPSGRFMPAEPRLCEMQPGRVVALFWMHNHIEQRNLPNHLSVSHDGGQTWSQLLDTGEWGQAPNLLHWRDDVLLTAHAQRERDIGLYVRLVDFSGDRWRTMTALNVWDRASASKVAAYATMAQELKFGQPSFLRLDDGEVLLTHWGVVDGRSCILTHRLRIRA